MYCRSVRRTNGEAVERVLDGLGDPEASGAKGANLMKREFKFEVQL
jgi:hypothetical protein